MSDGKVEHLSMRVLGILICSLVLFSASLYLMTGSIVPKAVASQTQYTVVSGDSLWRVANQFGVTVEALKQANSIQSSVIFPGQKLSIPGSGVVATASTQNSNTQGQKTYTVQAGDSLFSIAQRTSVSAGALKRANNVQNDFLAIGQQLVIPAEPQLASRSGARVQTILDYARSLQGTPYRWGGNAPGGFDCSGYVNHVFARHGISLPRTTYDQFNRGTSVSRGNLQPGDLVFFTTYRSGPSHVGIYIGNSRFIHASSSGGGVIQTDINSQYYANRFLGGRRIIP